MASITKTPHGTWKARIRKDGADFSKTFETKASAQAWARRKARELDQDRALGYAESKLRRLTFGEVALAYLEQYVGRDRERHARVRRWIDAIGSTPILRVDHVMVREHMARYMAEPVVVHGKKTNRKKGAASHNRQLSCLSAVFHWAIYALDLPENPCGRVKFAREARGCERFLSREEVDKLLQACKASNWDRLYLFVLMALHTGARRSELTGLKWSAIDWEQSAAYVGERKNGKPHVLVLQPQVMAELRRHDPSNAPVVSIRQVDELVFRGRHPLTPRAFDTEWKRAQARAGIEPLRVHDLRHTAASLLAQAGASLLEVGDVLGHSNLASTRRYAHLTTDNRRALLERVLGDIGKEGNGHE